MNNIDKVFRTWWVKRQIECLREEIILITNTKPCHFYSMIFQAEIHRERVKLKRELAELNRTRQ